MICVPANAGACIHEDAIEQDLRQYSCIIQYTSHSGSHMRVPTTTYAHITEPCMRGNSGRDELILWFNTVNRNILHIVKIIPTAEMCCSEK